MSNVRSTGDTNSIVLRRSDLLLLVSMTYFIDTCLWDIHKTYIQSIFFPTHISSNKKSFRSNLIKALSLLWVYQLQVFIIIIIISSSSSSSIILEILRHLVILTDRSPFSCLRTDGMLFVF